MRLFNYRSLLVILLFAAIAIQVALSIAQLSPTNDEIAHHVATGYSYLKTGDFKMNPATPPLVRELAAVPLLFMRLQAPFDHPSWEKGEPSVFGHLFFYEYNPGRADAIIFWSRIPILILSLLLALAIFMFSKRHFGFKGGLLSLALYSFCPNMLANSTWVMSDLCLSLFLFVTLMVFYEHMRSPKMSTLIFTGILSGLTLSAKYSGAIIFVLLPFSAIAVHRGMDLDERKALRRPPLVIVRDLLVILFMALVVLWGTYGFEWKPLLKEAPDLQEKIEYIHRWSRLLNASHAEELTQKLVHFASSVPIPLSTYGIGMAGVTRLVAEGGIDIRLLGHLSPKGYWYYYIIDFLIKTPVPTLILILLFMFKIKPFLARHSSLLYAALLPILVFFVASLFSRLQIGIRYILPIYPFIYFLLGWLMSEENPQRIQSPLLTAGLLIWLTVGTLSVYPNYHTFFNEIAGGPEKGAQWIFDSDFGQSLRRLTEYAKKHKIEEVHLLYYGTADPAYEKGTRYLHYETPLEDFPKPGIYAVSLIYLPGMKWVQHVKPSDDIDNTIFIYRIP